MSLPIAVAVGSFLEATAWPIEQRVGFGPTFDRPRFQTMGSESNQVPGQIQQQILPELSAHFAVAGFADSLAVLAQRIDAARADALWRAAREHADFGRSWDYPPERFISERGLTNTRYLGPVQGADKLEDSPPGQQPESSPTAFSRTQLRFTASLAVIA